jgi:invasion protein IalB
VTPGAQVITNIQRGDCVTRSFTYPQGSRHVPASIGVKTPGGLRARVQAGQSVVEGAQTEDLVMTNKIVSASARPMRRSFFMGVATALLTVFAASAAFGQAPRPAQPAQPARPAPGAPPAQAPAAAQPSPNEPPLQLMNMPQLVFTPWIKMCGKGPEATAKQVCVTQRAATTEMGLPMVQAALIEAEGERKSLTVMVPVGVVLAKGARITIDQDQPIGSPFSTCFTNGCMAQFEASNDTIAKLKAGQSLLVQAVALPNLVMNMALPLSDFKKANEGPPTDPKVAEEQQKKYQEELQKRADDARKRLEAQSAQPAK